MQQDLQLKEGFQGGWGQGDFLEENVEKKNQWEKLSRMELDKRTWKKKRWMVIIWIVEKRDTVEGIM